MTNPDLARSSSTTAPLGRFVHLARPMTGLRAVLAAWAAPVTLAFVVGLVLLATPWSGRYVFDDYSGAVLGAGGVGRLAFGLANLAAIAAVVFSRYRLGLACVLVVVPWMFAPLAATMA